MVRPFFVTGLPRTRTAWFSVFLSHNGARCYHEALNGCQKPTDYIKKMAPHGRMGPIGNSDCGLPFLDPALRHGPTVIIHRDIEDVLASLARVFPNQHLPVDLLVDAQKRLEAMDGMHIPYEAINQRLPAIWGYLIGGGFDPAWADQVMALNIQTQTVWGDPQSFVFAGR